MTKLIILDRDGVINYESVKYIKNPDEWLPIPGSLDAIAKLTKAGFTIAIATNQAGIGRGIFDLAALNAIHEKMTNLITEHGGKIKMIKFCPHHPDDKCNCRKPQPGLLLEICQELNISLPNKDVIFIGDSLRDINAAKAAGVTPVLVLTGNGQDTVDNAPSLREEIKIYDDLAQLCE